MKDPDKAIICGTCKLPVTCPSDPDPDDQIVCLSCGARDPYKKVWETCLEHIKHRLHSAVQRGFAKARGQSRSPVGGASPGNVDEPFFKWRIKD